MIRNLVFILLPIFAAADCFSQNAEVVKLLEKYRISPGTLDSINVHYNLQYSFDLKTTIVTEGSEKVYAATHDPSKPGDAQWTLNTVNGGAPSRIDLSTFKKQHSEKIPPPVPDKVTYRVEKEDAKELAVSFHYDPASLVTDNEFMQACLVTAYFDVATGKLLRSEARISEPFKIKMFKGDNMSSNVTYRYMENEKRYLPEKEEIVIDLKVLGRPLEMITVNEYSNYKKM